jgi:hypothetical protein
MPRNCFCLTVLLAGCGGDVVHRIPGGNAIRFHGVTFDVPSDWSSESSGDGMRLLPDDSDPNREVFLLVGDPAVRSLDGSAVEESIQRGIAQLQIEATKTCGPAVAKFGAVEGRKFRFEARARDGRELAIRVYAFLGDHVCALVALGTMESLTRRGAELDAVLGSMAKGTAANGRPW